MLMKALRAAAFAIVGLAMAAPADANGQVENAMQLWMGDLRSAYDDTRELITAGNTNDGAGAAANLQKLAEQMNQAVIAIGQNANALTPELGAVWSDTLRAMDSFSQSARTVAAQVGVQTVDLSTLESYFETADDAVHASWDATKTFGQGYGAMTSGPVESAKQLFSGAVTDTYRVWTQYIKDEKNLAAQDQSTKLKALDDQLQIFTGDADVKAQNLGRALLDLWHPTYAAFGVYQTGVNLIIPDVGKTKISLSDIDARFSDLNAAMVRSYKDVLDFGARLRVISDDWR